MSTTTRLVLALPFVLAGWLAVLVVVGLVSDAAPAYVVVLPRAGLLDALPEGSGLMAASSVTLTLSNPGDGLAREIWRHGALLVLPAGLPGCLPLPPPGGP